MGLLSFHVLQSSCLLPLFTPMAFRHGFSLLRPLPDILQ